MADSAWVYRKAEPGLWTVGFYDGDGAWEPESDHDNEDDARDRVHYLNGGTRPSPVPATPPTPPPTPGPLVRLETGDWVDPNMVSGLQVVPRTEYDPPAVRLMGRNLSVRFAMEAVTDADARELAARIAAQINAARRGGGEDGR